MVIDLARSNYLSNWNSFTFLTLDPFNHTYNPSKNIKMFNRENRPIIDSIYQYNKSDGKNVNVFEDAFRGILINKKLDFKCYA